MRHHSPVVLSFDNRLSPGAVSSPFRISVKAIVAYGQQVLLLRKVEGKWDLPGGKLNEGENPLDCLVRELHEEAAIEVESATLADCAIRRRTGNMPIFAVFYLCRPKGRVDDIRLSEEHNDARLFRPADIDNLKLYRSYKEAVVATMSHGRVLSWPWPRKGRG
jgi:8-oxo-dGTP pyrophosphatase MutT (NUDIX family)